MKIFLQNGESITIVAPTRTGSSARIAIQTEGAPVATVIVEDGLLGDIQEHVCRRRTISTPTEDRLTLWAHLVAMHAGCYGLNMTLEELVDIHDNEHNGPCGIRNHDPKWRGADLCRIGTVLSEADPDSDDSDPPTYDPYEGRRSVCGKDE